MDTTPFVESRGTQTVETIASAARGFSPVNWNWTWR